MRDFGGVTLERGHDVPMRDGVVLSADLYRPAGKERFPVLLQRTPYNKTFAQTGVYAHPAWYARQGYVVVVQDVRGRGASGGRFDPYCHEAEDGADTIWWAASLEGTTGQVGTFGFSYAGINQILAAGERPAGLACAAVGMAGHDFYDGWTYRGGALQLAFIVSWTLQALAVPDALKRGDRDTAAVVTKLAADLPTAYRTLFSDLLRTAPLPECFRDWVEHDSYDEFWRRLSPKQALDAMNVPCLHVGGWYDVFIGGTLKNFAALRERAGRHAPQYLVVGPWQHIPWARLNGDVDAGSAGDNCIDRLQIEWFDHWLKGRPLDRSGRAVRYFELGSNVWQEGATWPPASARPLELFLHSDGRANSLSGDGVLSETALKREPPDIFVYDPSEPVPSIGGASCCRADAAPVGAFDQRAVEIRNDVLVYTGDELEEAVHIAGPVEAVLYASTDAPDTDFTAKLVDVFPDGRAINLCDGIFRARFRSGFELPAPLSPGEVIEYRIDLGATANCFGRGHRIRLEVSSSSFPAYDVNDNTGARAVERESFAARLATQVILHDDAHPSRLRLTVVDPLPLT